jgi:hypothetical protein
MISERVVVPTQRAGEADGSDDQRAAWQVVEPMFSGNTTKGDIVFPRAILRSTESALGFNPDVVVPGYDQLEHIQGAEMP